MNSINITTLVVTLCCRLAGCYLQGEVCRGCAGPLSRSPFLKLHVSLQLHREMVHGNRRAFQKERDPWCTHTAILGETGVLESHAALFS